MPRPVSVYRPNSEPSKGSAFQFHSGSRKRDGVPVLYAEAANQTGPKPAPGSKESPFDWDNKVRIMLNVDELGEIVASVDGLHRKAVKLIHKSERDGQEVTSSFELTPPTTEEGIKYGNWGLALSITRKSGNGDTKSSVRGFIAPASLVQLKAIALLTINRYLSQEIKYATKSVPGES